MSFFSNYVIEHFNFCITNRITPPPPFTMRRLQIFSMWKKVCQIQYYASYIMLLSTVLWLLINILSIYPAIEWTKNEPYIWHILCFVGCYDSLLLGCVTMNWCQSALVIMTEELALCFMSSIKLLITHTVVLLTTHDWQNVYVQIHGTFNILFSIYFTVFSIFLNIVCWGT